MDTYWLPGGGQQPGETLAACVEREVLEKFGMRVKAGRLIVLRDHIAGNHLDSKIPIDTGHHRVEAVFWCGRVREGQRLAYRGARLLGAAGEVRLEDDQNAGGGVDRAVDGFQAITPTELLVARHVRSRASLRGARAIARGRKHMICHGARQGLYRRQVHRCMTAFTHTQKKELIVTTTDSQPCNFTINRPTLKLGSSGEAVKQAQCYLNLSMQGDKLLEDGSFGPVTEAATKRFQKCAEITVDGIVAAQTWSFLTFWANSPDFVC
ncbi:peptidoglycan-binding protein [Streptomyces syringium]|uniref:peptidoglycan-binding protein n=1 Tax=Streptomyces syringium TaxID=76729 RepID=UPI003D9173E7